MIIYPYTTTATLTNKRTLILDASPPLSTGRVRVTIEHLPLVSAESNFLARLEAIHARLLQSGYPSPTVSEVTARLQNERDSWEDLDAYLS